MEIFCQTWELHISHFASVLLIFLMVFQEQAFSIVMKSGPSLTIIFSPKVYFACSKDVKISSSVFFWEVEIFSSSFMCMRVSREASTWGRMSQGLLIWGHGCAAASTPLVERLFLLPLDWLSTFVG